MNYAYMMYTPTHTIPNKAIWEKDSGHSPLEGITTPFPAGQQDCTWDDLFTICSGREDSAGWSSSHTIIYFCFLFENSPVWSLTPMVLQIFCSWLCTCSLRRQWLYFQLSSFLSKTSPESYFMTMFLSTVPLWQSRRCLACTSKFLQPLYPLPSS